MGGIVLAAISSMKNISFKNINTRESTNEKVDSIFSKLNFEKNKTIYSKEKDKIDEIREYLLPKMVKKSTFMTWILLFILLLVIMPIEISLMYLVIVGMFYVFLIYP